MMWRTVIEPLMITVGQKPQRILILSTALVSPTIHTPNKQTLQEHILDLSIMLLSPTHGDLVKLREAVGFIAGQIIGKPGTQLT